MLYENQVTNLYNYNYDNWKTNLNSYQHEKQNLEWHHNPKPIILTEKMIKERENILNPITQKYNNEEYHEKVRLTENKNQQIAITRSFDNSLRNEQTYDLINLKDKLAGFENHPNYPKLSEIKKKKLETSRSNYNILSNITLDKHSSFPPESRPTIPEDSKEIRFTKVNSVNYKDYDIITNKYKFNHDEKSKTDYHMNLIESAKNYWNKRNFDPIKLRYIDDTKEEEYQKQRKEKENKKINEAFKKNNEICNYVYNVVIDPDKLIQLETKEKNKKKRYNLKRDIENYYANRNSQEFIKNEQSIGKKISYNRYRDIDERGYNILNLEKYKEPQNKNLDLKNQRQTWDILLDKVGDNQTLNIKKVFKNPYDTTDYKKSFETFKNIRNKKIQELPLITEDNQYKLKSQISVKEINKKQSPLKRELIICNIIDKDLWFTKNRNLDSLIKHEKEGLVISPSLEAKTRILRNSLAN